MLISSTWQLTDNCCRSDSWVASFYSFPVILSPQGLSNLIKALIMARLEDDWKLYILPGNLPWIWTLLIESFKFPYPAKHCSVQFRDKHRKSFLVFVSTIVKASLICIDNPMFTSYGQIFKAIHKILKKVKDFLVSRPNYAEYSHFYRFDLFA